MTQVDQASFSCNACGKQFRWKPELAGKAVKCKCGSPIRVPKQPGGTPAAARGTAARSAHVPPPPPPPPPPAPPKAKPAKRVEQDDDGMDALYALADQEASGADDASTAADSARCPACRGKMAPEAVLCLNCGFDRRKGSVLKVSVVDGDDAPPKRRLFGLLAPKKIDPSKKKVVDKMAPQGSFFVGIGVSAGMAVCAALIWFLVAWGTNIDVYYLVALVGVAAGVGMQIGQKGYSSLGGFTAAGITLVVMLCARAAVFLAILYPDIKREMARAEAEEDAEAEVAYDRVETKDAKTMLFELAEKGAAIKAEEQARRERGATPRPPEDPRVIEYMTEQYLKDEFHLDPAFADIDQIRAAREGSIHRATTRPAAEKQKMIAVIDARREKQELIRLVWDERVYQEQKDSPGFRSLPNGIQDWATPRVEAMTPEQQKSELKRLREKMKAVAAEEAKEYAAEIEKEEMAEAADGLEDGDGLEDMGEDEEVGDEVASAAAAPAVAAPGAAAGGASAAGAGSASSAGEEDDDSVAYGFGYFLAMVVFGGSARGILFILGSLGIAYYTAAGATWD